MEKREAWSIVARGVENTRSLGGRPEGYARDDDDPGVGSKPEVLEAFEQGTEDPGLAATLAIRLMSGQLERLKRGEPMSLDVKTAELVALYARTLSGVERDRRKDANAWSGKSDQDLIDVARAFMAERGEPK